MIDPSASPAHCIVRACRLLDREVSGLQFGYKYKEEEWLTHLLMELTDIDELRTARELVHQVLGQDRDPFHGLFILARQLITFRNGLPQCKDNNIWHQISALLDTDLLISARLAIDEVAPPPSSAIQELSWPSVLASQSFLLEKLQQEEIVDTHVHLGGALPGSFYWVAIMSGYTPVEKMYSWVPENLIETWSLLIDRVKNSRLQAAKYLLDFPQASFTGGQGYDLEEIDWENECPIEPFVDYVLNWLESDPKKRMYKNPVLGERYLLWIGLREIIEHKHKEFSYDEFLMYLRFRNSFIRYFSHNPNYRGLAHFQTTIRRHRLLFREFTGGLRRHKRQWRRAQRAFLALERFRFRHALRYQFSDPTDAPWARDYGKQFRGGLKKTEFEGVFPNYDNTIEWVDIPESPWRPARQVEIKVKPIFSKLQLRALYAYFQGLWDFVKTDRDAPLLRVGLIFQLQRLEDRKYASELANWQTDGILAILDDVPELRPFVVGIDAAGAEMATPPRELAGSFIKIRDEIKRQRPTPGHPPIVLGRTCHAGEDFRDLLTGLRYVDDAVTLLDLEAGERLGHGLALAVEPERWYRDRAGSYPQHGDHILDLIWAKNLARLVDHRLCLEADLILEQKVDFLLSRYLDNSKANQVSAIINDYANLEKYPSEAVIYKHLGLAEEQLKKQAFVAISPEYIAMVKSLQKRVRQRVSNAEIILEICPTSNFVVGKFAGYEDLPYLNLNRYGLADESKVKFPISFSINSDDPGVFQTTVANEYRLLGMGLVNCGFRHRDVIRWLDEARNIGILSSFIPPWSPPTRLELLYAIANLG